MAYGGRVITVVAEATNSRMTPVIPSSESARQSFKHYHLLPKNMYFTYYVENVFVSKYCLSASHDYPDHTFLGEAIPELLFNQFIRVL